MRPWQISVPTTPWGALRTVRDHLDLYLRGTRFKWTGGKGEYRFMESEFRETSVYGLGSNIISYSKISTYDSPILIWLLYRIQDRLTNPGEFIQEVLSGNNKLSKFVRAFLEMEENGNPAPFLVFYEELLLERSIIPSKDGMFALLSEVHEKTNIREHKKFGFTSLYELLKEIDRLPVLDLCDHSSIDIQYPKTPWDALEEVADDMENVLTQPVPYTLASHGISRIGFDMDVWMYRGDTVWSDKDRCSVCAAGAWQLRKISSVKLSAGFGDELGRQLSDYPDIAFSEPTKLRRFMFAIDRCRKGDFVYLMRFFFDVTKKHFPKTDPYCNQILSHRITRAIPPGLTDPNDPELVIKKFRYVARMLRDKIRLEDL